MIQHHPSPELLEGYASGTLDAGTRLVVACHLHECSLCRAETGLLEAVGGAMLEASPAEALRDDALQKALSRLDAPPRKGPASRLPRFMERYAVPTPLAGHRIGFRRWVTPSIWFAPVHLGEESSSLTYLVFADRDTTLAQHTHGGREYTFVLHGSFTDNTGAFAQGDFQQTDENILHAPAVTEASPCLCLSTSQMPMQLTGRVAQVIQSLLGTLY